MIVIRMPRKKDKKYQDKIPHGAALLINVSFNNKKRGAK